MRSASCSAPTPAWYERHEVRLVVAEGWRDGPRRGLTSRTLALVQRGEIYRAPRHRPAPPMRLSDRRSAVLDDAGAPVLLCLPIVETRPESLLAPRIGDLGWAVATNIERTLVEVTDTSEQPRPGDGRAGGRACRPDPDWCPSVGRRQPTSNWARLRGRAGLKEQDSAVRTSGTEQRAARGAAVARRSRPRFDGRGAADPARGAVLPSWASWTSSRRWCWSDPVMAVLWPSGSWSFDQIRRCFLLR